MKEKEHCLPDSAGMETSSTVSTNDDEIVRTPTASVMSVHEAHPKELDFKLQSNIDSQLPKPKDSRLYDYSPFRFVSCPWKIRNPYIIAAISTMGGLLFGFACTNMSPFIGNDDYNAAFGYDGPDGKTVNAVDQGGISSAMPGGAFIGSMISSGIAGLLGRNIMMQVCGLTWLVGCAIQCSCINRASLVWGRLIMGASVGIASSNVPLYLAELSPSEIRGRLTACFQLAVDIGMLVMYVIAYGCSKIQNGNHWTGMRLAWGLEMIPGGIMWLGSLMLPESPRWLGTIGYWDRAQEILVFLRGQDMESQRVQTELLEYKQTIIKESSEKTGVVAMWKGVSFGRTFSALSAQAYQQLLGSGIVLFYTTSLFDMSGRHDDVFRFSVLIYAIFIGMTLPTVFWLDRWSRRWTFLLGSFGMMSCMIILAAILGAVGEPAPHGVASDPTVRIQMPQDSQRGKAGSKAAIAFTMIFFGVYGISWAPIPWTYLSEIFPPSQRSLGNGWGSASNWLFNFAISLATPPGFINITWKMYLIFAVFGFVSMIHIFICFPETHGKSLEEMALIFDSHEWAFKTDPVYLWFKNRRSKK